VDREAVEPVHTNCPVSGYEAFETNSEDGPNVADDTMAAFVFEDVISRGVTTMVFVGGADSW
jgi:hypothetical protein